MGKSRHASSPSLPCEGLLSEDLVDSRMPTDDERAQLEIPPDTPVTIIKGTTHDSEHRTLHVIDK
jgi:hypothetical protein